ncbi:hypothetical protein C9J44_10375 [Photobacterium sp. GB-27]|nr:hypothetical protein C9J44_10375 [Photobacterium sp. GB-27]
MVFFFILGICVYLKSLHIDEVMVSLLVIVHFNALTSDLKQNLVASHSTIYLIEPPTTAEPSETLGATQRLTQDSP